MRHATGVLLAVLVVVPLSATAVTPVERTGAAAQDAVLEVQVVDQEGDPVGGAHVRAGWDGGSDEEDTASDGRVLLDVPEGADVDIEVDHQDYVRNRPYEVTDASATDIEVPVWKKGGLTVMVEGESADGPTALSNAELRLTKDQFTRHVTTNESGVFESGGIEQGTYTVRAVHPGYYEESAALKIDGNVSQTLVLEPGSVAAEFRVIDDHFDEPRPVADAALTVTRDGEEIASGDTQVGGEQTLRVPVNTQLRVTAEKEGYETSDRRISVGERTELYELTVNRAPRIDVEALSERVVTGEQTILEATDEYGDPVVGATVLLDDATVGTTDQDGELRFTVEETGERNVTVRTDGLTSDPLTITAISGDTQTTAATTRTTEMTTTATATTETTTATQTTATETTTTPETPTESGGVPGFTLVGAVAAVLAAMLARGVRR